VNIDLQWFEKEEGKKFLLDFYGSDVYRNLQHAANDIQLKKELHNAFTA
jgi:hypothetical protein